MLSIIVSVAALLVAFAAALYARQSARRLTARPGPPRLRIAVRGGHSCGSSSITPSRRRLRT